MRPFRLIVLLSLLVLLALCLPLAVGCGAWSELQGYDLTEVRVSPNPAHVGTWRWGGPSG